MYYLLSLFYIFIELFLFEIGTSHCFVYFGVGKPEVVEWKNNPILFYDKLAKLFEKYRATWYHEDTVGEIRANKVANVEKSYGTTIKEIDHLVETNNVILEEFDDEEHHSNNSPNRSSDTDSQDVSSSRIENV